MKKIWILLVVLALAGTITTYAQTDNAELGTLDTQTRALDNTALRLGEEKTLHTFAEQLGVPYDTLVLQRQQSGFGMGQLFIANSLAAIAPEGTFDAISQEFQSGKGWGEIAKENGVTLGSVIKKMKRSNTAIERTQKNQMRAAEMQKTGGGASNKSGSARPNSGQRGGRAAGRGQN